MILASCPEIMNYKFLFFSTEFSNAKANGYGISNIIGNAAEMTLQEGIARGGTIRWIIVK
jgi:hypothetical protein